jgi:hypothetical protein
LSYYKEETPDELVFGNALEEYAFNIFEYEKARSGCDYFSKTLEKDSSSGKRSSNRKNQKLSNYEIFVIPEVYFEEETSSDPRSPESSGAKLHSTSGDRGMDIYVVPDHVTSDQDGQRGGENSVGALSSDRANSASFEKPKLMFRENKKFRMAESPLSNAKFRNASLELPRQIDTDDKGKDDEDSQEGLDVPVRDPPPPRALFDRFGRPLNTFRIDPDSIPVVSPPKDSNFEDRNVFKLEDLGQPTQKKDEEKRKTDPKQLFSQILINNHRPRTSRPNAKIHSELSVPPQKQRSSSSQSKKSSSRASTNPFKDTTLGKLLTNKESRDSPSKSILKSSVADSFNLDNNPTKEVKPQENTTSFIQNIRKRLANLKTGSVSASILQKLPEDPASIIAGARRVHSKGKKGYNNIISASTKHIEEPIHISNLPIKLTASQNESQFASQATNSVKSKPVASFPLKLKESTNPFNSASEEHIVNFDVHKPKSGHQHHKNWINFIETFRVKQELPNLDRSSEVKKPTSLSTSLLQKKAPKKTMLKRGSENPTEVATSLTLQPTSTTATTAAQLKPQQKFAAMFNRTSDSRNNRSLNE